MDDQSHYQQQERGNYQQNDYQPQGNGSSQQSSYPPSLTKPDSNLVWAILCTVLCCIPLGIVSIVYACKVDSLWSIGAYQEAYDAANKAKKWAIWGAISAVVLDILIGIFYVLIFIVAAVGSNYNY